MLRVGIVAGEASGDLLGADLIRQLRERHPDMVVAGIGGEQLQAVGCKILAPMERLAVIGLIEVAGKYIGMLKLRNRLLNYFLHDPPAIFIGIDAPDFNIGLEQALRRHGIKTVHYVSPSVWAWRKNRIHKIKKAVDFMLTLFPFEQDYYQQAGIPSAYVGHPLANRIALQPDRQAARDALGLDHSLPTVALLPGSRDSEIATLSVPFIEAAMLLQRRHGTIQFISSLLDKRSRARFSQQIDEAADNTLTVHLYEQKMSAVLQAADVALLASGTVTLEAMLYKCPMVVAYRINPLSYHIIKAMSHIPYIALPNILASRRLVEEYIQADCKADKLADAIHPLLSRSGPGDNMRQEFTVLHRSLLTTSHDLAAASVLNLLDQSPAL